MEKEYEEKIEKLKNEHKNKYEALKKEVIETINEYNIKLNTEVNHKLAEHRAQCQQSINKYKEVVIYINTRKRRTNTRCNIISLKMKK